MMNQRQYLEFVKRQLIELREERAQAIRYQNSERVQFIEQRIEHFENEIKRVKAEQ